MEANAGMVAGSHKRNEFVMIRNEGEVGVSFSSALCSFVSFFVLGFLNLDQIVDSLGMNFELELWFFGEMNQGH